MKTKQKIINKALDLYNVYGLDKVEVRQLADQMDLNSGNITRHFSKKEYLANAIAFQFSEKNNLLWQNENLPTLPTGQAGGQAGNNLKDFFSLLKSYMLLQTQYRCLFISFANLQTHHPEIAERNKKEEEARKIIIGDTIAAMTKNGELKKLSKKENDFLIHHILLILKFWISEALISHPKEKTEVQINYFLQLIKELLGPYKKIVQS